MTQKIPCKRLKYPNADKYFRKRGKPDKFLNHSYFYEKILYFQQKGHEIFS